MPRSKNYLSYAEIFRDGLMKAYGSGHSIECESFEEAKAHRWDLYGYIKAIKASKDAPTELLMAAHQVSMRIEGDPVEGPATLIMFNKDQSRLAQAMRKSLGRKSQEEEAEESARKLQERLNIEPQATPNTPEYDPMQMYIPMRPRVADDPKMDEKTKDAVRKYGGRI